MAPCVRYCDNSTRPRKGDGGTRLLIERIRHARPLLLCNPGDFGWRTSSIRPASGGTVSSVDMTPRTIGSSKSLDTLQPR
jgi:hypothetical protein